MTQILIIEDDPLVRETTVDMLEAEGYSLISADNGRKGVELAIKNQPDLIICDIMMPQLDGYGVLNALKQEKALPAIPFIFLTAKAERSDWRLGMQLGADDYLVKPFTRGELLASIQARLRHHAALAEYYNRQLEENETRLLNFFEADILQDLHPVSQALDALAVALFLPETGNADPANLKLFSSYPTSYPSPGISSKLAQQALLTGHPGYYRLKDGCYAAYLPLLWKDELLGVLGLVRPLAENQPGGPEVLDHPYQRRLLTIQYQLGLALNNARLTEQTRLNTGLEETSDLTSSILSAVSHELRTPLTSIKTAVSGLKDNVVALSPEEQQDYISMIDQEVDRLDKLIHQILDHSRIEAGKLQSEKGLFFLPEIVHSTVDRLGRLPLVARHPVQTDIEADLPLVYLDFIQVEEVLTNLLENAAKYSEPGTHILIRVRRMPRPFQVDAGPAQLGLLVEVIDGGMGIPESELERVFQKYYRVNSVTNGHTKTGGLGLGLAIARSLVKAHDGEIWAYLNQEKGTTFAFWLPF